VEEGGRLRVGGGGRRRGGESATEGVVSSREGGGEGCKEPRQEPDRTITAGLQAAPAPERSRLTPSVEALVKG